MRPVLACAVLSLALLSRNAFAADDCLGPDLPQMALTACASQRWQRHDHELNTAWAALVKQTSGADLDKLKAAQRAWLQYRDLECTYEGTADEGGSAQPMDVAVCKDTLTVQRLSDFKRLMR